VRPGKCFHLTLAGVLVSLTGCHKEGLMEPSIQTVRAGAVASIRQDTPERYSTTIAPVAQVDLAFKSAGLIERIHQVRGADGRTRSVQAGDQVTKDTELAQVRAVDYQQRVDQATSQLAQTEAQQAQAQAQLAQARANFSEAEIEYKRAANLFQSASLVKPQFDQAKGRYETAEASVKAAEAAVKGAEAAVVTAQAALSQSKLSLSDTSVRAPFDGWVTARNVDLGSLVGNATVGFSMIDIHRVKAVFAVPDSSLELVRLGQRQTVMLDTLQHDLQGVVTSIAPQADPKTRVFSVEVTLDNLRSEAKPGMIGSLTLGAVREPAPRLVVPLGAVVRAPSNPRGFAVFRLVEHAGRSYAEAQVIQIGQTIGNSIEVTSGLSAGQRIVSLGGSLVRNGQEVRVLPGE
jgi:multidrug efflux system membrane fusion protein